MREQNYYGCGAGAAPCAHTGWIYAHAHLATARRIKPTASASFFRKTGHNYDLYTAPPARLRDTNMLQNILLFTAIVSSALVSGQGWSQIPEGLVSLSGNLNYIWGVNSGDQIFKCQRPCTGSWTRIPGALVQVDVDDQFVWGVNSGDAIYYRPVDGSGAWTRVRGLLIHVSASGNGYIWGVNRANNIFKCKKPCTGGWVGVDGLLRQIDGGEREVCGVNAGNNLYCRPVDGSGAWRLVSSGFKHVSTSGTYDLHAINTDEKMMRCRKPCLGQWISIDHSNNIRFRQCDATANALFAVDTSQTLWRKDFPL